MKQSKKMLAMLLALVMVFTMLPMSVFAASPYPFTVTVDGTEYIPEAAGTVSCTDKWSGGTATAVKIVLPQDAIGKTITFGSSTVTGGVSINDETEVDGFFGDGEQVSTSLTEDIEIFCISTMDSSWNELYYHLLVEYEGDAAGSEPSVNVSSAEAKPGDEVTLIVSVANRPDLMAMRFTVEYDETRLEKVSYTGSGMGGGTWDTTGEKLLWYNMTGDTVYPDGQILELKYKVKGDAPAGDAEVKVAVFDNGNWDEEEFEFTANPGKVTVAACEHTNTTTTYTQVSGTQTHTGTTTCDTCGATTATVPAADCADADNNQKCDTCGGDVLPATVTFPFELTVDGAAADVEVVTTSETCTAGYNFPVMQLKVNLPAGAQSVSMKYTVGGNYLTRTNGCNGTQTVYGQTQTATYNLADGINKLCVNVQGGEYHGKCYHVTFETSGSDTPSVSYPFSMKVDGADVTPVANGDAGTCSKFGFTYTPIRLVLPQSAKGKTLVFSSSSNGMLVPNHDYAKRVNFGADQNASYTLPDAPVEICINYNGTYGYHLTIEYEGGSENPDDGNDEQITVPFTAAVGDQAVEVLCDGTTEKCYGDDAMIVSVTVPANAQSLTLNPGTITDWSIYADEDVEVHDGAGSATVNIADVQEYLCICNMDNFDLYHLYINVEESDEPDTPAVEGYTVTMPADIEVMTGETVSVPVVIDNGDVDTYNAFDISFTYDSDVLTLTSTTIEGMTVTNDSDNGIVTVQRYGSDLSTGSTAFTLTFQANGTGETTVAIDDTKPVKVGIASNAHELDASDATVVDADTKVTIGGYTVTLPDDFTGEGTVKPGDDYDFEAKDKNYDYTVKATIDGEEITVADNGDGTYTIPADQITGNIVITSEKTGKLFDVTLGEDMTAEKSGEDAAQYMTPYVATLTKEAGYGYNVTVTINNIAYTGFEAKDNGDGTVTYTIPGAAITGDIVFDSGKEAGDFTVTVEGTGAGDVTYEATAEGGKPYSFTVTKAANYTYTVSATMGGKEIELTEADGTYTIAKVTGDIVITVNKTTELTVEVSQYLELDGKTIFLVKVPGTLEEGKAYAYNGETMYYSNVYNAWSWLVIVEEGQTFTAEDALAKLAVVDAEFTTLDRNCDVNMTHKVDVNDAQLVYNMYNCHYDSFDVVSIEKFLYADTTGDGTVNTQDATAIVAAILAERNQG